MTAPEENEVMLDPWEPPEDRGAPADPGEKEGAAPEPAEPEYDEEARDGDGV